MGEYLRLWWAPRFEGPTRADRQGGWYHPYSPDLLAGWDPLIPGSLAATIGRAETAVRDLNGYDVHPGLAGVSRFLLRAESVGSSAIEGLRVGPRRVLAAEEQIARGAAVTDSVAAEVAGNIDAMRRAVDLAAQPVPLTLDGLLEVHRLLMDHSPTPELGGALRDEQGWIGGGSFNPCNAAYVPPPPDRVAELMRDLVAYVNTDHHSPLTQAAVAHAQFETIHPFADGNGRAGRALIHIVLRRRGLAPRVVPPISLVLATWSDSYIEGLTDFRHEGLADSPQRDHAPSAVAGCIRGRYPEGMRRRGGIQRRDRPTGRRVEPEVGPLPQRIGLGPARRTSPRGTAVDSRQGSATGRTFPGSYPSGHRATHRGRYPAPPALQQSPQPRPRSACRYTSAHLPGTIPSHPARQHAPGASGTTCTRQALTHEHAGTQPLTPHPTSPPRSFRLPHPMVEEAEKARDVRFRPR